MLNTSLDYYQAEIEKQLKCIKEQLRDIEKEREASQERYITVEGENTKARRTVVRKLFENDNKES